MLDLWVVVSSLTIGPRVGEAMWRTIRWLDRCIETHQKSGKADVQNLFAIVQGGIDPELRDQCLEEMIKRRDRVAGYAIGGLSGGEEKGDDALSFSQVFLLGQKKTQEKRLTTTLMVDVFWRM